jgi:hypothetical protein
LALVVVVVDGDDERVDDISDVDEFCCGILDDGIQLFVVEASLKDGVVTDRAAGISKLFAESPATILIGAYKEKKKIVFY